MFYSLTLLTIKSVNFSKISLTAEKKSGIVTVSQVRIIQGRSLGMRNPGTQLYGISKIEHFRCYLNKYETAKKAINDKRFSGHKQVNAFYNKAL
jgi:hypothetical protein